MKEEFKYIYSVSSTVSTDPVVCAMKDAKIEDAAKEVISIFRQRPHVKSIDFTFKGYSIRVFPHYSVKNIVDIYNIYVDAKAAAEKQANDAIKDYFNSSYLSAHNLNESLENIIVSSVYSCGFTNLYVRAALPTNHAIFLKDAAKEVLTLFDAYPQVNEIYFTFNGMELKVLPSYTVEDIERIYKITLKSLDEKDKQIEKYLASKTTNAGV